MLLTGKYFCHSIRYILCILLLRHDDLPDHPTVEFFPGTAGGWAVQLCRTAVPDPVMGPFGVVCVPPVITPLLLHSQTGGGRRCGVFGQGPMHPLVASVLGRASGRDAVGPKITFEQPHRKLCQPTKPVALEAAIHKGRRSSAVRRGTAWQTNRKRL